MLGLSPGALGATEGFRVGAMDGSLGWLRSPVPVFCVQLIPFPMGPMSLPCWVFGTPHVRDAQEMPEGFDMNAGGMSSGREWGGKEKSLPLILRMGTEAQRVEVTSSRFHS